MRTAWLLPLALLGCSAPDPAVFGDGTTLAVGSASATSAASTSSSSATSGVGGAGGQGGASTSTSAGGAGGMGGQGGGLGGGGGEPCEPDPNPCDGMPDGTCGDWTDSCGNAIVCGGEEACGSPLMHCDDVNVCRCQDATGYGLAVNTCAALGSGVASFCGDDGPNADAPVDCVDTGVQAPGGSVIWCCG